MLKSLTKNLISAASGPPLTSRDDLAAAEQALSVARDEFDSAALDALTDPGDTAAQRRRAEAARTLEDAREKVASLQAAARAAAGREAQKASREAAEDLTRRRATLEAASKARLAAVAKAEAAAQQLAAAWEVISRCSEQMAATGLVGDPDGGLTRKSALEGEFRIAVAKAGLKWAASFWPWPLEDRQPLSAIISAANQHVLAGCQP